MAWQSFLSSLSKLDDDLEELLFSKEIEDDNFHILNEMTIRLRDQTMNNLKRIQLCSDLKKAINQVFSYSTIADQIICRYETLVKKYPKDLQNVFCDFRDPTKFKEKALETTMEAFIGMKAHGYGSDVIPMIDLLKLRTLQVQAINIANNLHTSAFGMATNTKIEDDDTENKRYEKMSYELDKARAEIKRLSDENEELRKSLIGEKSRNDILSKQYNTVSEEKYRLEKQIQAERIEYNARIQNLLKSAAYSSEKDNEIAMLKEQIASLHLLLDQRKQ